MNQARSGAGIDSILSIYARAALQERARRHGRIAKLVSDLELQRQFLDEWAI